MSQNHLHPQLKINPTLEQFQSNVEVLTVQPLNNPSMSKPMTSVKTPTTEQVLTIPRSELTKQGIGKTGIYGIDISKLSSDNFAWVTRTHVDNKSNEMVELGVLLPQLISYYQFRNPEGEILVYRRKGKEEGLLGKYSIGVGGHIDITDAISAENCELKNITNIAEIIRNGIIREILEEVGYLFDCSLNFEGFHYPTDAIAISADDTAKVHVGLIDVIDIPDASVLKPEPAEYQDVQWLSVAELKANVNGYNFEPWSKFIIEQM